MRNLWMVVLCAWAGCGGAALDTCPFEAPVGPCAPAGLACNYGERRCVCAANANGVGATWLCDGAPADLTSSQVSDGGLADLAGSDGANTPPDLTGAGPSDLTTSPPDLLGADLSGADLSAPPPDLAPSADLAAHDLAATIDLAPAVNLNGAPLDLGGATDGGGCANASTGEPDNTCAQPQSASTEEGRTVNLLNLAIAPGSDVDTFSLAFVEGFHICTPGAAQPLAAVITATATGGAPVELTTSSSNVTSCTNVPADWQTFANGLCVEWSGTCGVTDDRTVFVHLRSPAPATQMCSSYTLSATLCRVGSTCNNCIL